MITAIVVKQYTDKQLNQIKQVGEKIDVTEERFAELLAKNLVEAEGEKSEIGQVEVKVKQRHKRKRDLQR